MKKIIAQGAEAVLYLDKYQDHQVLVKERVKKGYRTPELDKKIRSIRTKREENLLDRARRAGVTTPRIWDVNSPEFKIIMEYVDGKGIKDTLNDMPKNERMWICELIGKSIARLHSSGIMHGDLTTSNMILKDKKLYLIDFGLGRFSQRVEDQAVDLFLLYEALKSTHFRILNEAWKNILNTYKQEYSKSKEVLNRIDKIRVRRRYRGE